MNAVIIRRKKTGGNGASDAVRKDIKSPNVPKGSIA